MSSSDCQSQEVSARVNLSPPARRMEERYIYQVFISKATVGFFPLTTHPHTSTWRWSIQEAAGSPEGKDWRHEAPSCQFWVLEALTVEV